MKRKRFWTTSLVLGIVAFTAFSFRPPSQMKHKSDLKILPKDISHEDLMTVMHSYEKALNYKCSDCHAPSKTDPGKLDFASYDNPHKKVALDMMKMVERINRKEFGIRGDFAKNYIKNTYMVTCYTCHHGSPHPEIKVPLAEEK